MEKVASVLNLLHTTSPPFLLLSLLDCARRNMVLNGTKLWTDTLRLYREVRAEINGIAGLHSLDETDFPEDQR